MLPLLLWGKSIGAGDKDSGTRPADDRRHPADITSGTLGAVVPAPLVPRGPDQSGESPNSGAPGGTWPWGPRGLTVAPRSPANLPVDSGWGPASPGQPGDMDTGALGRDNLAPDANSGAGARVLGVDTNFLAQVLSTIVQGLAPLAEAVA